MHNGSQLKEQKMQKNLGHFDLSSSAEETKAFEVEMSWVLYPLPVAFFLLFLIDFC